MVIPQSLYDTFYTKADLFIEEINAANVTVFYGLPELEQGPTDTLGQNTNFDRYGGRTSTENFPELDSTSGVNQVEGQTSESFKVRLYAESKKSNNYINKVIDGKNYFKLIAYATDGQKLRNAQYIETIYQGKSIRLFCESQPINYGLGPTKRYCMSYWEER